MTLSFGTQMASLARPASRLALVPRADATGPFDSWFGRVLAGLPEESWPCDGMRPLIPLCQINLAGAPHLPAALNDLALIAIFISGDEIPYNTPNGQGWMLRAYTHEQFTRLIPIEPPVVRSPIKPVTMGWEPIALDYPAYDDLRVLNVSIPEELVDCYADEYPNHNVSKLGGWPSLIQSEIIWPDSDQHAAPEFVLQIDSEEGNGWFWGDAGTGYIGRGTGEHRSLWSLDWQCY